MYDNNVIAVCYYAIYRDSATIITTTIITNVIHLMIPLIIIYSPLYYYPTISIILLRLLLTMGNNPLAFIAEHVDSSH